MMRVLSAFGLAVVLSIAAPAWGQIGLVEELADDLVEDVADTTGDLLDETVRAIGDLDTGVGVIDETVDTTVDVVDRVVDDVDGTGEEPTEPEPQPEPDPQPPPPAEPEPTRPPPDTRQTQVAADDQEPAVRDDDRADLPVQAPQRVDESGDDEVTAGAGRGIDGRRTFDTLAASRRLTAAPASSASTLFDRALDWVTSSGSLLAILAGPLLALQVLLRALLSAGSGLVAPASLLAAFLAVSLHDRRRPGEPIGS